MLSGTMTGSAFHTHTVTFEVAGERVVGTLHHPQEVSPEHPSAALVFEGPLTSVRDQVTGNYARAMAERGWAALSIDHRHFGESAGEPRQYEHPGKKAEDIRAAVAYLSSRPDIAADRIGAVGVCAGAGYLARAVADAPGGAAAPRIRAWGTVAGFFHDAAQQKAWMGDGYDTAIARARAARERYETTGHSETIPAVGTDGEVAMPLAEAFEYYGTARGRTPTYRNEFALMSREHTLPWDAQSAAKDIAAPTLMIHSEHALAPGLARAFFAALAGPKEELWVESNGQIDFYDDPALVQPAADRLDAHFRRHL